MTHQGEYSSGLVDWILILATRRKDGFRVLRQAVTITGLGTHKFKAAVEGILQICSMFEKSCTKKVTWEPGHYESESTVECWNRYLTNVNRSSSIVPLSPVIDPKEILASASKQGLVHTEDNQVL